MKVSPLKLGVLFLLISTVAVTNVAGLAGKDKSPVESVFKWKTIFYGPTNRSEKDLIAGYPYYQRENIIPTAVAYHVKTSMMFIAAPRIRPGVVATLNSLDLYETFHLTSPIWTPYPSQQFNELKSWHFAKHEEKQREHEEQLETEQGEYQEGDDCGDNWKRGPGFCPGFYKDDANNIPNRPYLPEGFLSADHQRRREDHRDRRHHKRSSDSDRVNVVKIRISSSFPHGESEETEEHVGSATAENDDDELDTTRIGLSNVRKLKTLISVNSLLVDQCHRLWYIDTGVLNYGDGEITVQRPSLWVVDVREKDLFLIQRRYEFDEHTVPTPLGLRGFSVDIRDATNCDSGVAYIANGIDNRIVVYDLHRDDAWFFKDQTMKPATGGRESFLQFPGFSLTVNFGITDLAVGWKDSATEKSIFYAPFTSNDLFVVSSGALKRRNVRYSMANEFKQIGGRGAESQTESITFDEKRGILFYVEVQSRSVKCWNVQKQLRRSNIGTVFEHKNLDYPAHVSVDSDGNLWVLSNRLPVFLHQGYNHDSYNIHLYRIVLKSALKDSVCV